MLKFERDWPPASFGLPAPEEAEALAVPGNQGLGPHDDQSVAPIERAAEQNQRQAGQIVGTSGLDLALLIEREQTSAGTDSRLPARFWSASRDTESELDHTRFLANSAQRPPFNRPSL